MSITLPESLIKKYSLGGKNKRKPILVGADGEEMFKAKGYVNHLFEPISEHGLLARPMSPNQFLRSAYEINGEFFMTLHKKYLGVMKSQREISEKQVDDIGEEFKFNYSRVPIVTPFMEDGEICFALADGQHSTLGQVLYQIENGGNDLFNVKLGIGLDPLLAPSVLNNSRRQKPWVPRNDFHSQLVYYNHYREKEDVAGVRACYQALTEMGYKVEDPRYDNGNAVNDFGREAEAIWKMGNRTKLFEGKKGNLAPAYSGWSSRKRNMVYKRVIKDAINLTKIIVGDSFSRNNRAPYAMISFVNLLSSRSSRWKDFNYDIKDFKAAIKKGVYRLYPDHDIEENILLTYDDYVNAAVKRLQADSASGDYKGNITSNGSMQYAMQKIIKDMVMMEIDKENQEQTDLPKILSSKSQLTHN